MAWIEGRYLSVGMPGIQRMEAYTLGMQVQGCVNKA